MASFGHLNGPRGAVQSQNWVWDVNTLTWVKETQPGGSGGGGTTQYAEDTAAVDGEQLVMVGVVRKDTRGTTVSTDGDRSELQVNSSGDLRVDGSAVTQPVAIASVTIGGGKVPVTDATMQAAIKDTGGIFNEGGFNKGFGALGVRRDTPTNTTGVDATFGYYTFDSTGRVWVSAKIDTALPAGTNNIGKVDVNSSALPTGAATETTLALVESDTNTISTMRGNVGQNFAGTEGGSRTLAVRKDTPVNYAIADGKLDMLQMSSGRLWTSAKIDTALPTGSNTIGKVDQGTGGSSAWKVDGSAVTQPVSGTITANAGTGPFTDQHTDITTDYDTGAGTQNVTMFGIALPKSGGAVAGGTSTDPVRVDPTGNTTQPVSGTVTANAGTNLNTSALALSATQTDRTQKTQITDGTRDGTVKAASTLPVATDTAIVVTTRDAVTVSGTLTGISGTLSVQGIKTSNTAPPVATTSLGVLPSIVSTTDPSLTDGNLVALSSTTTGDVRAASKITDGTNTAAVKAASTATVAADPSLVVAMSPNSLGYMNISRINNVVTPTGNGTVSGVGALRVTVGNDSTGTIIPWDGTNKSTVKAASTAPVASDTALVVTLSPNSRPDTADVQNADDDVGYSDGDLVKNLVQTPDGRLRVAVAAKVSDSKESYLDNQVRSLSLTSDGSLRVSATSGDVYLEMFTTPTPLAFDLPDLTSPTNPYNMDTNIFY